MKKLRLNVDALTVQSFATADQASSRGTVHGEECTCPTNCTCPGCPSCGETCPNTCAETCDDATCNTCDYSCWDTCQKTCYTWICPCMPTEP
jgi:hypothetical protein